MNHAWGERPALSDEKIVETRRHETEDQFCLAKSAKSSSFGINTLYAFLEQHRLNGFNIEIHLIRAEVFNPRASGGDQIIAVPTLVRRLPTPVKKIIGDLSNTERVLVGLELRPAGGGR
jgi:circadian clock protein KaiB